MNTEIIRDESQHMSGHRPQLVIALNSHIRFEAQGPGGLRLSLMHNLTDFSYYIIIVIEEDKIILGYATRMNDNSVIKGCIWQKVGDQWFNQLFTYWSAAGRRIVHRIPNWIPSTDNIWAVITVWMITGKIIKTVLCRGTSPKWPNLYHLCQTLEEK